MNESRIRLLPSDAVDTTALAVDWYGDPPEGIRANMVTSLDGEAAFSGRVRPLSGATDQALLRALRIFADVVLVGAGTVRAERYGPVALTDEYRRIRDRRGAAGPPPIAVVTSTGALPEQARLEGTNPRPIVITTTEARNRVVGSGADIIAAGDRVVDLRAAVGALQERGMRHILCEGGPTLLAELVAADLVDELCLTVSPRFAGAQPQSSLTGPVTSLAVPRSLSLAHALAHDDFLFLRYGR